MPKNSQITLLRKGVKILYVNELFDPYDTVFQGQVRVRPAKLNEDSPDINFFPYNAKVFNDPGR